MAMELPYRSGITGILDKNLEKGKESARNYIRRERLEINACWKESGARE